MTMTETMTASVTSSIFFVARILSAFAWIFSQTHLSQSDAKQEVIGSQIQHAKQNMTTSDDNVGSKRACRSSMRK